MINLINKIFGRKEAEYEKLDVTNYNPSVDDITDFITKWNINFPIDRWWRRKHDVAFNSPVHREVSFLDMRVEWEEDKLFEKMHKEDKDPYRMNIGQYFVKKEDNRTEEEKQKDFKDQFRELMQKSK